MKKVLLVGMLLIACISLTCEAQSLPKNLIAVVKPNVNVRQAANASAAVVMKAPFGTVFEMVSRQPGWYEVKEAFTGKKGYISASVTKLRSIDDNVYYPETNGVVGVVSGFDYENVSKKQNSETTRTYTLKVQKEGSDVVLASLSTSTADTSGRMRTYENYYKGKQMGWYIVLTEETDYEGVVQEKLDTPIIIFKDADGRSGICVQGVYYKEAGNPFN